MGLLNNYRSNILGEHTNPIHNHNMGPSGEPSAIDTTSLNEALVIEKTTLIELKSLFGTSVIRDVTSSISGASITLENSELHIQTTPTASSKFVIESAEYGKYIPGLETEVSIAVRAQNPPVGEQIFRWGYFDDNNGYFFGQDVTGTFIAVRNSGSDSIVRQENWNIDVLNGNGISEYDLSKTGSSGHIWNIKYIWHGYGKIEYKVSTFNGRNAQKEVVFHRVKVTGSTVTTSILNPHLPIRVEVDNGTTLFSASLFFSCRSLSIQGKYQPTLRTTSEKRLSYAIGTSNNPLISFKRNLSAPGPSNIKISSLEFISTDPFVWEIRHNSTLSGANFTTPTTTIASETTILSDVSAVSGSDGLVISTGIGDGATGGKANIVTKNLPKFDFVRDLPVSLFARTITGGGTIHAVMTVSEEW